MMSLPGNQQIICTVTNDLTYDRRMARICTTLAEASADVTLVGRHLSSSIPFSPGSFKGKRLRCFFNKGFLFYAEYNTRLLWYLLFAKYDIACACDLDTALPVRLAGWLRRKKTVYDAHEYFTEVPEIVNRPLHKAIWAWIANRTIKGFDLRYTVGHHLAKIMSEKYSVPFDVIRNIPSFRQTQSKEDGISNSQKILLYQGAINVGRGLEEIIRTMLSLAEWEFWLAGEGDITEELQQLARQLKVEDRVKLLGWVAPEDLPGLMRKATIGINLREAGSMNDYYSLPNKFFDFIHARLPSIHMNYPEYREVIDQYPCALLIEEVSQMEIATALQKLNSDTELTEKMKAACASASAAFTWEREGEKLISLYRQLSL